MLSRILRRDLAWLIVVKLLVLALIYAVCFAPATPHIDPALHIAGAVTLASSPTIPAR